MHRFFIHPSLIQSPFVHFPPEVSAQLSRVLRLSTGDIVTVLDNTGQEMLTRLTQVSPRTATGEIISSTTPQVEPSVRIHLFISLTQREKLEWILQKCTEVGVSEFTPIITSRTLVQKSAGLAEKHTRWEKIIREAAEQSGRTLLPILNPVLSFNESLSHLVGFRLLAWEMEQSTTLRQVLQSSPPPVEISLIIGPEGGFSDEEVETAVASGFRTFTLGKRILRVETAAVIAAALILHELDR
jgi:16S rRNA (uracil1498-N3)-methyltransferase